MTLVGACGRLGYEAIALPATYDGDGDVQRPRDGEPDQAGPRPEPARDGPAVEPTSDGPPPGADPRPDGALPVDTRPPVDMAPLPIDMAPLPVDMALPIDTAPPRDGPPDVVDMPPAPPMCTSSPFITFPASDLIADFEDGTLKINRTATRGGMIFHPLDVAVASAANVAQTYCGQRAMQVQAIGSPSKAALMQAQLMLAGGANSLVDASGYRGISLGVRATSPMVIRLKLPNEDTLRGGNDHFQVSINVGTTWNQVSVLWSAFRQNGTGTQFPGFNVSTLWAVEISAPLPAGGSLWVDNVGFVR